MTFSENVQQPGAGMLGEPPAAPRESVAEWWVGGAGPAGRTYACPSACSSCVDGKNSNMSAAEPRCDAQLSRQQIDQLAVAIGSCG